MTGTICKGGTEKKGTIEEKLVECTKCSYYINVLKNKTKELEVAVADMARLL